MKVYWIIGAGACGLLAIFFAMRQEYDRAFICAVIGSVLWFLGYRNQMKSMITSEEPEEKIDSDEDERS